MQKVQWELKCKVENIPHVGAVYNLKTIACKMQKSFNVRIIAQST